MDELRATVMEIAKLLAECTKRKIQNVKELESLADEKEWEDIYDSIRTMNNIMCTMERIDRISCGNTVLQGEDKTTTD